MNLASGGMSGICSAHGAAVQATAAGLAVRGLGSLRNTMQRLRKTVHSGPALDGVGTGYVFVYLIEIALLFATLIAVGTAGQPARNAVRGTLRLTWRVWRGPMV